MKNSGGVYPSHDPECVIYSELLFVAIGNLKGYGVCKFTERNSSTHIQFVWNIEINKAWMSIPATFAYLFLNGTYRHVMQSWEQSLIRRLNSSA